MTHAPDIDRAVPIDALLASQFGGRGPDPIDEDTREALRTAALDSAPRLRLLLQLVAQRQAATLVTIQDGIDAVVGKLVEAIGTTRDPDVLARLALVLDRLAQNHIRMVERASTARVGTDVDAVLRRRSNCDPERQEQLRQLAPAEREAIRDLFEHLERRARRNGRVHEPGDETPVQ